MYGKRTLAGLAASVATGALLVTSAPAASAASSEPAPGGKTAVSAQTQPQAAKVWKNVWHTAPSYYSGTGGPTGGVLNTGSNYFYCQAQGMNYSDLGYHNNWWLLTDDDSGNTGVWINAVYVSGGGNNQPIPGVPYC